MSQVSEPDSATTVSAGAISARIGNVPAMVRNELETLPAERQDEFLEDYQRRQKKMWLAYVLWFLGGWHFAYMRRWGLMVLFFFTAGGVVVWWVIEAFMCKRRVNEYNRDRAIETLRNLKAVRS